MSKKIKIGVFGGFRGKTMINFCLKYPETELVAICDKYEPILEECKRLSEKEGAITALYKDFDEFLKHDMDAVVLANFANEHAPYAVKCLNAGKHVISEVLPVQCVAEAVQLVEAVEKSGKVYAYAENYCYFRGTSELRKLYKEGKLGEFRHGEGEYIHNCEAHWHNLTYGERSHWRNITHANFYCTHSIGPIVHITGLRPKRVTGFELSPPQNMLNLGRFGGEAGIAMIEMENGGTLKSITGGLQREPGSIWYSVYGSKGMGETSRWNDTVAELHLYTEENGLIHYHPAAEIDTDVSNAIMGHGGGDFYTMHYFIQKIFGNKEGEESIDVYEALDMALPGLLSYRSILNGNEPVEIPNFRNKEERGKYRFDTACCDPKVAGENLLPSYSKGNPEIKDEVYDKVKKMWQGQSEGNA